MTGGTPICGNPHMVVDNRSHRPWPIPSVGSGAWIAAMAFCRSAAAARSSERADFRASFSASWVHWAPKPTKNVGALPWFLLRYYVYWQHFTDFDWFLICHTSYSTRGLNLQTLQYITITWHRHIETESHHFAGWIHRGFKVGMEENQVPGHPQDKWILALDH